MRNNTGMDIVLNGQTTAIKDGSTLQQLLEAQQLATRKVAIEVNAAIIPRSQHANHHLQDGDTVEIVHALGGG